MRNCLANETVWDCSFPSYPFLLLSQIVKIYPAIMRNSPEAAKSMHHETEYPLYGPGR